MYQSEPKPKKHRFLRVLFVAAIVSVVLSIVAVAGLRFWYAGNLKPLKPNDQTAIVVDVVLGMSPKEIGDVLESHAVIRSSAAFQWYVRSQELRDQLQAGRYELTANESVQRIVERLIDGDVSKNYFTILPAKRVDQIEDSMVKAGFARDEVRAALAATAHADHPALSFKPASASLEGYLYPETFQITSTTTAHDVIDQSLTQLEKKLTPERLAGFSEQGLTPHEAIILASIVEQEVGNVDDRRIVAQVFLRRLSENIALGSDVTYFYAAAVTGQEASPSLDSPYNTRLYRGLPPGPISNVSEPSLDAVAFPASTNYLYFVAGDDGQTYFSYTQAEHEDMIRKHCGVLCQ
jgi:UPF0755 protein